MRKRSGDGLALAEKEVRKVLKNPRLTTAQRLKAIEILAKLVTVKHKVSDGGGDGSFFTARDR
jgi:hypothetical protein